MSEYAVGTIADSITPNMPVAWDKLKNLVHYVCVRASDLKLDLGRTKLHKIIWYAESIMYAKTFRRVTYETFTRRNMGPMSDRLGSVLEELVDEGKVFEVPVVRIFDSGREYRGYRYEINSAVRPDMSEFNQDEIDLLDSLVDFICKIGANEISEMSHGLLWQISQNGAPMSMDAILASPDEGDIFPIGYVVPKCLAS